MSGRWPANHDDGSVWQLFVSYAIGAWIVLQVGETLSSLIGLPLWFGRVLLTVLGVGFAGLVATSLVRNRGKGRAGRLAGLLTWKRLLLSAATAAGLLVLVTSLSVALRATGTGPFGTLQAQGILQEEERLLLADFEGGEEVSDLSQVVTALMRIDLAQSQAFAVLEPIQVAPVLARMRRDPAGPLTPEVALEAARREGVKAIIVGELLASGRAVVIVVRIVDVSSGATLMGLREAYRDPSDIPQVVDRLSAQLRERIGESLRSIQREPPLAEVTTASMYALDRYSKAIRAYDLGDARRAIGLLDEAIAEDSTFAMAYRKLGIILNNNGLESERATGAFRAAYDLRDNLTRRERGLAEAAYLTYVEGDESGAIDRYVTLLESYPTDRVALNNLAAAMWEAGRISDAVELSLRSIHQGGAPANTYMMAVTLLNELRDTVAVREVLEGFASTYPGNPDVARVRESSLGTSR